MQVPDAGGRLGGASAVPLTRTVARLPPPVNVCNLRRAIDVLQLLDSAAGQPGALNNEVAFRSTSDIDRHRCCSRSAKQ